MPVVDDDLWKNPGNPGMIVVSSHASIQSDGRLYMAYGEAQEAARRIPGIEYQCGNEVLARAVDGIYGFLPVRPSRPEEKIIGFGLFQTQIGFEELPDPDLIKYSMECLRKYVSEHHNLKIRMDFPGLGTGGLAVEEISPLLVPLPSTITVCHHGEVKRTVPGNFVGFKALYLQVESMLQEGRYHQAVEFLMGNGFDIQSAMEQVDAVQRLLRERAEKNAERVRQLKRSDFVR